MFKYIKRQMSLLTRMIYTFLKNHKLNFYLFAVIFAIVNELSYSLQSQSQIIHSCLKYNIIDLVPMNRSCLFTITKILLLLSNDVESNPGPESTGNQSSMSLLHQNIRSIRNKIDYIKDHFSDFDILCFTETHLTQDIINDVISIEPFDHIFRKDFSQYSSGFLVYTLSRFRPKRIMDLESFLPESLCIELNENNKQIALCTVYRPPIYRIEFWDRLNIFLEKVFESYHKVILVGDINEDQLNDQNSKFRDIIHLNNMTNLITEPTRVTDTTSTLLDPIAISNNLVPLNSGVQNPEKYKRSLWCLCIF